MEAAGNSLATGPELCLNTLMKNIVTIIRSTSPTRINAAAAARARMAASG